MTNDRFAALRAALAEDPSLPHYAIDSPSARYIAACDPSTIRALLDAAEERDKLQQDDAYIALKLNNDDLRASAEQFKAERDRLRAVLLNVLGHTAYNPAADFELLAGLLASVERIVRAALSGMEKP